MNKFFTLLLMSLIASNAQSQMDFSGMKLIEGKADYKKYKFQDEDVYTISTKKFSSQKDAENFCKAQKMSLDTEGAAVLFAMSGAASSNKFLREAITYNFSVGDQKETGIWFWAGEGNKIVLVRDGGGMSSENITPDEYEKALKKKPGVPAICTTTLKKVAENVGQSLEQVKGDKADKDIGVSSTSRNIVKERAPAEQGPSPVSHGKAK